MNSKRLGRIQRLIRFPTIGIPSDLKLSNSFSRHSEITDRWMKYNGKLHSGTEISSLVCTRFEKERKELGKISIKMKFVGHSIPD